MKNFALPKTKLVSGYTWIQSGITSYTGNANVRNRFASSASLGAIIHLSYHDSIWIQESYNKVVTVPWYTTSSVSYTYSWCPDVGVSDAEIEPNSSNRASQYESV